MEERAKSPPEGRKPGNQTTAGAMSWQQPGPGNDGKLKREIRRCLGGGAGADWPTEGR